MRYQGQAVGAIPGEAQQGLRGKTALVSSVAARAMALPAHLAMMA
jgi:hypothetical protein